MSCSCTPARHRLEEFLFAHQGPHDSGRTSTCKEETYKKNAAFETAQLRQGCRELKPENASNMPGVSLLLPGSLSLEFAETEEWRTDLRADPRLVRF